MYDNIRDAYAEVVPWLKIVQTSLYFVVILFLTIVKNQEIKTQTGVEKIDIRQSKER